MGGSSVGLGSPDGDGSSLGTGSSLGLGSAAGLGSAGGTSFEIGTGRGSSSGRCPSTTGSAGTSAGSSTDASPSAMSSTTGAIAAAASRLLSDRCSTIFAAPTVTPPASRIVMPAATTRSLIPTAATGAAEEAEAAATTSGEAAACVRCVACPTRSTTRLPMSRTLAAHRSGQHGDRREPSLLGDRDQPAPAEARLRAVDQRLGLRGRDVHLVRDLPVRPALELAEHERVAVGRRHLLEHGEDEVALHEALVGRLGRVALVLQLGGVGALVLFERPAPLPADDVERDVLGDPRHPRRQRVPAVEPVQALEDTDHRLLQRLVRVLLVAQEAAADAAGERAVPGVDLDVGLGVSGLEVQHEHAVVQALVRALCLALVGNPDDHVLLLCNVGEASSVVEPEHEECSRR